LLVERLVRLTRMHVGHDLHTLRLLDL